MYGAALASCPENNLDAAGSVRERERERPEKLYVLG